MSQNLWNIITYLARWRRYTLILSWWRRRWSEIVVLNINGRRWY